MKFIRSTLLLLLAVSGIAMAQSDDGDAPIMATDEVVDVREVPENILASAKKALPGAYFTQVIRKVGRDDILVYRFDASQVGRYWVLVVRDDGEVVEKYQSSGPVARNRNS